MRIKLKLSTTQKGKKWQELENLYPHQMAFLRKTMTAIEVLSFFNNVSEYVNAKIEIIESC